MKEHRRCIVIMAKQPIAGETKTRLAAELGHETATALYEAFLLDTLATCRETDAEMLISYAPGNPDAARYFVRVAPDAMLTPQPNAGFGQRLFAAMQAAFDGGFEQVAVIGSDIPHIQAACISAAFDALESHDAALGPTRDGGYYLLALNAPQPELFREIEWSSGRELQQTLEGAVALELRLLVVDETFDIDAIDDLISLRAVIATDGDGVCPRTAAAIEHLDRHAVVPSGATRA